MADWPDRDVLLVQPNVLLSDFVIPANSSVIVADEFEIGDGVELDVGDEATLEIT